MAEPFTPGESLFTDLQEMQEEEGYFTEISTMPIMETTMSMSPLPLTFEGEEAVANISPVVEVESPSTAGAGELLIIRPCKVNNLGATLIGVSEEPTGAPEGIPPTREVQPDITLVGARLRFFKKAWGNAPRWVRRAILAIQFWFLNPGTGFRNPHLPRCLLSRSRITLWTL